MEKRNVKGRVWTSVTLKNGEVSEMEEIDVEVGVFVTTPAMCKVSLGRTLNMGNYESARVDVGVELPAYVEEVTDGLRAATRLAKQALAALVADKDVKK